MEVPIPAQTANSATDTQFRRSHRQTKIVATLGPSSSEDEQIRALFQAGANVFRLNFSHGSHAEHRARYEAIRRIENEAGRPIGILMDLQGPKMRLGVFQQGKAHLETGQPFRLDLQPAPGSQSRAPLPHPEIFAALSQGKELLLDDGKIRLRVVRCGADYADTVVVTGGNLSDRKGVNIPGAVIPISALTDKDRRDLAFALELGADWIALSFVQRPQDVIEARSLIAGRARIMAKLEKPAAIESLQAIVAASDAVMVARGDLGVELPPEDVPGIQKTIIGECRRTGKPVVVATQMLESMILAPTPTRAEASDVAGAVYDRVDAVMLSAESASGRYPREAVAIMDRIIRRAELDIRARKPASAESLRPEATEADAISLAVRQMTESLPVAATVAYTTSGATTLRLARERPVAPILCITPSLPTARWTTLVWGAHTVNTDDARNVEEMVDKARKHSVKEGFALDGDRLLVVAGMPFGTPGATNLLRIAKA